MSDPIQILFENDNLLVLNKPAGIVVNRAESVVGQTVQDWMEEHVAMPSGSAIEETTFRERSGVAHRLDKETSGILLSAKNPEYLWKLLALFKERKIQKTYLSLVHGLLEPKDGFVKLPIGRNPYNRHKFMVDVDGKPAYTEYTVLNHIRAAHELKDQGGYSLVEAMPHTGRTHQIRVHLLHIGHPLVGDELYLSRKRMNSDRSWCPRHFLHARRISFIDPVSQNLVAFEADLPRDLEDALAVATCNE